MKRMMILPFDPHLPEGAWIIASAEELQLQHADLPHAQWTIHMPEYQGAWIPFHLLNENFRVSQSES